MKNNQEPIMMDYEKLVEFIAKNSGFSPDKIGRVLDLETEYMIQLGIIKECEQIDE